MDAFRFWKIFLRPQKLNFVTFPEYEKIKAFQKKIITIGSLQREKKNKKTIKSAYSGWVKTFERAPTLLSYWRRISGNSSLLEKVVSNYYYPIDSIHILRDRYESKKV